MYHYDLIMNQNAAIRDLYEKINNNPQPHSQIQEKQQTNQYNHTDSNSYEIRDPYNILNTLKLFGRSRL